jgi:ribonucleoside-triphosphate reductase
MATPTRVGFQCPFSNVTLDLTPSPSFAKQPVIIGGEPQNEVYGDFQEEMNMFNKAFYEVMLEGDKNQRVFTFPIPTVSITKNFDWENPNLEPMWEATAKYGINYFTNYINSDMNPEDVRSMCCRLRLDLTELHNRGGGGLFGAGALTGSIGVVTMNMPRIGYLSKTKKEFFERLGHLMDLAKESLELKRKVIENYIEKGLYPYSRHYLSNIKKARGTYYGNHFSTIGLVGMNEMLVNFLGENIASHKGRVFALEVMDFMRNRMVEYQKETGNIYNLEATPGESTSYRLCLKDKAKYPDIDAAGTKKSPYYTNSSQLPVNFTDDLFEALKLQDDIQCRYNGGTVQHLFLGERLSDTQSVKALVRKIFEKFRLPYITLTPTFSICPTHGYIEGEHFKCPKCTIEQPCEVYTRVVGYLRPVGQFNLGKQQEYKDRKEYKVKKESLA